MPAVWKDWFLVDWGLLRPFTDPAYTDVASGLDAQSLSVHITDADVGAGSDLAGSPLVFITTAETATGLDTQSLSVVLSTADTSSGLDANGSPVVSLSVAETGASVEDQALVVSVSDTDLGAVQDQEDLSSAAFTSIDAAGVIDDQSLAVFFVDSDLGSEVTEDEAVTFTTPFLFTSSDSGSGTDIQSLTALLALTDVGTTTDAEALAVLLSSSDLSSSTDVAALLAFLVDDDAVLTTEGQLLFRVPFGPTHITPAGPEITLVPMQRLTTPIRPKVEPVLVGAMAAAVPTRTMEGVERWIPEAPVEHADDHSRRAESPGRPG